MKIKKLCRKIICLLLIAIMIIGTLPMTQIAEVIAAALPTDDASWTVIGGEGTTETDEELFDLLKSAMYNNGNEICYIRLGEDIKIERSDYKWNSSIRVMGEVVFDLNGYTLDVTCSDGGTGSKSINLYLFYIGNDNVSGNKLTVVDSRGKGTIHTNGYIRDYEQTSRQHICHVFNIFKVCKGNELVINASGAEFVCGRSKKQWVVYNPYDGYNSTPYNGYAYNQICGSVVTLDDNSNLTVAGGKLQARGYTYIGSASTGGLCAAIYCSSQVENVNINIIDGTFYGKGGASAISVGDTDYNVSKYNRTITIRSGTFDVFKLNKIIVGGFTATPDGKQGDIRVIDGNYGSIGIPDCVLDPDNADIIIGGHNYSEDEDPEEKAASNTHNTTVIKPKTNTKTPDDRILLESENGLNSWNGSGSYIINAKNARAFFSDSDREHLDNDLQDGTYHYYLWTFTLYDAETGKKCDAEPMQRATVSANDPVSIDLKDYKQTNTTSFSYHFENDRISSYKIKAEVQEVWEGQHTYKSKFFNWFYFNEYSFIDISGVEDIFDFTVTPKTPRSDCSTFIISTENEESMEYYFEFLEENPKGAITCNSYYRYCRIDSAGKTALSSKQEIATGTEYGESIEFIVPPKHAGPVYVTVEYVFKENKNSSYVGHSATLTKTHMVYALDHMNYDIIDSNKVIESGYVSTSGSNYDTVELGEGEKIVIMPNISADMVKMDVKDPLTGNAYNYSEIKWQYSVGLDDNGSHIWYDVQSSEILNNYIDGVTLPCVYTNRTAWYRMSYKWNGQTYYSPQSLLVRGVSYESTRIPTVRPGDNISNIYGKGNNVLILHLNSDADWYTGGCSIRSIQISMVSMPTNASPATKLKTISGSNIVIDQYNNITLVNVDSFFADASGATEGEYMFNIRVIGNNANDTSYNVTASCGFYYRQETTDLNIYVNGTPIYEHDAKVNIPYILPANTNYFEFAYDFYPMYSNGTAIDVKSIKWSSSNSEILSIDEKTGAAKAYTPGTVTISCTWMDENKAYHTSSARVSVPIAGFELYKLDYSEYVGRKLTDVLNSIARVKSVWSYGGNKVTQNVDRYITVELTSWDGYTNGGTNFNNAKVEYNNNYRYGYTFTSNVNGGYFFPVNIEKDSEEYPVDIDYYVDTSLLQSNGLDNGDILPVEDYETTTEWNTPYRVHIDYSSKTYEEMYTDYMYISMYHIPVIEDPNAVYLNEVNITVNKPAVGDNRYEGTTYNPMNEYMILNISGLLASRKASDTHSYVSKLDLSSIKGSGKEYEDASVEDSAALAIEYMSVWNTTDYATWNKPTKLYEAGVYVHDVALRFDSDGDGTDGLKIYVAKDANVFVNGNRIDYADIGYTSAGKSLVSFKYYFNVGTIPYTNHIEIHGIDAPLQGELPTGVDDCSIKANGIETDDIYISKFIWFVDTNANGTYDEGEEAIAAFKTDGTYDKEKSTLWYDGRFLAGVRYSLYIELYTDTVRIDPDSLVWWYGNSTNKSFSGITSLVHTFPADMNIRTISIEVATSADTKKNDPLGLQGNCSGFKISFMYCNYAEGDDPTTATILGNGIINNGLTLPSGKVWLIPIIIVADGYAFAENVKMLVNGSEYCEEYTTVNKEIFVEKRADIQAFGYYLFTVTSTGVKISGTITSFGNSTDEVTIHLSKHTDTGATVINSAKVTGNSTTYSFENLEAGEYLIQVSKTKHASRTYYITVGTSDVTQNAVIWLYGDVTGDGLINATDATQVNRKYNGKASVFGSSDNQTEAYRLKVADVYSADNTINATDATQIARSYNNKSSVLDSMP